MLGASMIVLGVIYILLNCWIGYLIGSSYSKRQRIQQEYKDELVTENEQIKESLLDADFMPYLLFENRWIVDIKGQVGYKYNDFSGCYIILIFDEPVVDDDYSKYRDVYVGQSVHVCQRLHAHLNGKGNGDVYADVRNGDYIYAKMIQCDKAEMNVKEKELIRAFDAMKSYNNTRGGGINFA